VLKDKDSLKWDIDPRTGTWLEEAFQVSIELKLENVKVVHFRQVYAILDFLGDVGGLTDAFVLLAAFLIGSYVSLMFDISFSRNTQIYEKPVKTQPPEDADREDNEEYRREARAEVE
jgi:hypothetical protein